MISIFFIACCFIGGFKYFLGALCTAIDGGTAVCKPLQANSCEQPEGYNTRLVYNNKQFASLFEFYHELFFSNQVCFAALAFEVNLPIRRLLSCRFGLCIRLNIAWAQLNACYIAYK